MILYYLWRQGLLARLEREKLLFFLGFTPNPLFLSRRWPLWSAISWIKAVFSVSYARSVSRWLSYRVALFDGLAG